MVASLTQGLLGIVHAEFNRTLHAVSVPSGGWPGIDEAFRAETREFREQLRAGQLAAYGALAGSSEEASMERIAALTGFLEEALPRIAALKHASVRAIQDRLEGRRNTAAKELGHTATLAAELTREAIGTHAGAYRLALDLLDPVVKGGPLRERARSLPFDKAIPNGRNTSLSDVSQADDGAFIEIEGFIDQIRVVRSADGKLIGQLKLGDPTSGASASVAVLFVQPLHVGMTVGACARVSGAFRAQSELLDGEPAVEADRLPLADLADEAWRLALLRSAERYYGTWRNQTNMYWSLGPHETVTEDGAPVQGAGELIYAPFVRK